MVALPKRCWVKWSIDAAEEDVITQGGAQLLEDAGTLGVGDAVEVLQSGDGVDGPVAGHRVGARAAGRRSAPTGDAPTPRASRRRRTRVTSAVTRLPMYSANDSLSHRSSHHIGVVMLPNHWCAISWAIVVARSSACRG